MSKKNYKILGFACWIYLILSLILTLATIVVANSNEWNLGSYTIFIGSIITTVAAILNPVFSLKKFNLPDYKVKVFSLSIGIIIAAIILWLFSQGSTFVTWLLEQSKNGLIWGINTVLLLLNLVALDIKNTENKMNEEKEKILEVKKENLEIKKENLQMKKEKVAMQGQLLTLQKQIEKSKIKI